MSANTLFEHRTSKQSIQKSNRTDSHTFQKDKRTETKTTGFNLIHSESFYEWLIFFVFKRKLLETTLTLLNAIAAPAIIGFSKNPVIG